MYLKLLNSIQVKKKRLQKRKICYDIVYKPTNTKIDLIKWWHSLNRKSSFIWRKKNWKRRVRLLMEYSLRKWKKRKHKLYLYCNSITYPSISYIKDIWNTGSEFLWEQLYIWPFSHMVKRPQRLYLHSERKLEISIFLLHQNYQEIISTEGSFYWNRQICAYN